LNCLTGLDRSDAGTVYFGDQEITSMSDDALLALRRDSIGFVFQTFGLLPLLTARENIGMPLRLRRAPVREREEQVSMLPDLVGLSGHAEQRPPNSPAGSNNASPSLAPSSQTPSY